MVYRPLAALLGPCEPNDAPRNRGERQGLEGVNTPTRMRDWGVFLSLPFLLAP